MMHQKKSKKIFLYFFLLFLFGSITNISFQNSKLLSLKNITVSGLDDENNLDIINNLKRLKLNNIFFLNEEKIKNAREKLQDLYFDLYEYNAEAREEGESYREIKLNRATIKQNVQNELYGVNSTLSDLPSQTRPTATKLLKEIVPRGVD